MMSELAIDTIDDLLESSIEEASDAEIRFKLRTARQLLAVLRNDQEQVTQTLEELELTEESQQQLRELGYLD
jgi:hypothetical protein